MHDSNKRQRFNHHRFEIKVIVVYWYLNNDKILKIDEAYMVRCNGKK